MRWWPVAFALQRLEDARALPALLTLAKEAHPYTRAFAVKGLGALKDRSALPVLMPLLSSGDTLGPDRDGSSARSDRRPVGGRAAAAARFATPRTDPHVRLEAVTAHRRHSALPAVIDTLLDLLSIRCRRFAASALRSLAALDAENFVTILSGLDPDPHWSVRAALATVLGTLPPEIGLPRLTAMLNDSDQRAIPSVLAALVKLKAPNAATRRCSSG